MVLTEYRILSLIIIIIIFEDDSFIYGNVSVFFCFDRNCLKMQDKEAEKPNQKSLFCLFFLFFSNFKKMQTKMIVKKYSKRCPNINYNYGISLAGMSSLDVILLLKHFKNTFIQITGKQITGKQHQKSKRTKPY